MHIEIYELLSHYYEIYSKPTKIIILITYMNMNTSLLKQLYFYQIAWINAYFAFLIFLYNNQIGLYLLLFFYQITLQVNYHPQSLPTYSHFYKQSAQNPPPLSISISKSSPPPSNPSSLTQIAILIYLIY